MADTDRLLLRDYLGEVVIVLPDLEDPVADEDSVVSAADVRYMGILADVDDRVLKLHPYFLIPRRTDTDREREIAKTLKPEDVRSEGGLRARMTRGTATMSGSAKARAGSLIERPKIVPIAQVDSILLYGDEDPDSAIDEAIAGLQALPPGELESTSPPVPPTRVAVAEHAFFELLEGAARRHATACTVYVPSTPEASVSYPLQTLLALLAEAAEGRASRPEAALAVEERARGLIHACSHLDARAAPPGARPPAAGALTSHEAALEILRGFHPLVSAFLSLTGEQPGGESPPPALIIGVPALSSSQERFLVNHGCSHPNLVYVISRA